MSATAQPITAARFAAALRDLPEPALQAKVLELRNSLAHLLRSNEQLRAAAAEDHECADAARENEAVVARMRERIDLVRAEVVDVRGLDWARFEAVVLAVEAAPQPPQPDQALSLQPQPPPSRHPAWDDGTFQISTCRHAASLSDQALRAALEERMGPLSQQEDGVYL